MGGDYVWFRILQSEIVEEISHEIRMGMKKENLSKLILSKSETKHICWIKQDKEFIYRGEMYDVVNLRTQNQNLVIQCYKDVREKKLISDFTKTHDPKRTAELQTKKIYSILYFQQILTLKKNTLVTDFLFPHCISLYKSNSILKHFPPPKML
jgi:hypothetical protein